VFASKTLGNLLPPYLLLSLSVHKLRYLRYACLAGKAGLSKKYSAAPDYPCKLRFFLTSQALPTVLCTKGGGLDSELSESDTDYGQALFNTIVD